MAFIQVVKPKIKNSNPIIEIEITVFRVESELESTVSIFGINLLIILLNILYLPLLTVFTSPPSGGLGGQWAVGQRTGAHPGS